jgi:hypothetical protein
MPTVRRIFNAIAIMSAIFAVQACARFVWAPNTPASTVLIGFGVCAVALVCRGLLWVCEPLLRNKDADPLIPHDRR